MTISECGLGRGAEGLRAAVAELGARPGMAGTVVEAFGGLVLKRAEVKAGLAGVPLLEVRFDPELFEQGEPVLHGRDLTAMCGPLLAAASVLLPEMARLFPAVGAELATLDEGFGRRPELARALPAAILWGEGDLLEGIARELGVSPEILAFGAGQALRPGLELQAEALAGLIEETRWYRGYCPICGSCPDLGFLRPKEPEPSEFLVSKSGQLWLHCSMCSHRWRFVRVKCPHCGTEDHEKLGFFTAEGREGERIYTCAECGRYYPCLDLVEGEARIELDVAPLGLLHLDILAQERGFTPLARLPWNQLA